MKKSPITRITAGILGITSAVTLGVAQEAQAGTVRATSDLNVDGISLTLNGGTIIPLVFRSVQGSGNLGPFPGKPGTSINDAYAIGPVQCSAPQTIADGISLVQGANSISASSSIDCGTGAGDAVVTSSASGLLGDDGSGAAIGAYTTFTQNFTVAAGDTVSLAGLLDLIVEAEITGYGEGATKTAAADFLGTYEIFVDNQLVFAGPELDIAAAIVNQNGFEAPPLTPGGGLVIPQPIVDLDLASLGLDYTFLAGGEAEVQFAVRTQISLSNMQSAPEPSAVISLAAVGVGALVSRNKRKNSAK